jgi:hypothetical protein
MMNCITCQAELKKRSQKKFCNQSCAAKHNNVISPKRTADTFKCKTKDCNIMLKKSGCRSFCSECISLNKHLRGHDRSNSTIEEVVKRQGSNSYDAVRANCNNLYKSEKKNPLCQNCGYNKHIELCHIQPISSFPKETMLKIVNARENILFLCPNCHWEYDHGMLSLQEIKSGPTRN